MKYLILLLTLLPFYAPAQSTLTGLGDFTLGLTTPDSLRQFSFQEHELVVLKGTIAFPCPHIRVFTADSLSVAGLPVTNLSLVFYDDQLFRITCDYTESLQQVFEAQYGPGINRPASSLLLCQDGNRRRMQVNSRHWQNENTMALVTQAGGYNAQCLREQRVRLTIASRPMVTLTSECDLDELDPYFDTSWRIR
ncbi:hypothetical protein GCM10023187_00710 [Nibrella viscosa]|uniref:Uncharacterized protein n=1 Tax=Nibrella viscosa TaxID=1084524 RepID=A0ABP8JQS3_9BACT